MARARQRRHVHAATAVRTNSIRSCISRVRANGCTRPRLRSTTEPGPLAPAFRRLSCEFAFACAFALRALEITRLACPGSAISRNTVSIIPSESRALIRARGHFKQSFLREASVHSRSLRVNSRASKVPLRGKYNFLRIAVESLISRKNIQIRSVALPLHLRVSSLTNRPHGRYFIRKVSRARSGKY